MRYLSLSLASEMLITYKTSKKGHAHDIRPKTIYRCVAFDEMQPIGIICKYPYICLKRHLTKPSTGLLLPAHVPVRLTSSSKFVERLSTVNSTSEILPPTPTACPHSPNKGRSAVGAISHLSLAPVRGCVLGWRSSPWQSSPAELWPSARRMCSSGWVNIRPETTDASTIFCLRERNPAMRLVQHNAGSGWQNCPMSMSTTSSTC